MVMVYAGGHISGAHYNPAVTLAVWLRGKCAAKDVVPYMVSQVIGAALAAVVVGFLLGPGKPMVIASVPQALLAEFLFTFALAYVVLNVATAKGTSGNSFYGLAIGFTVLTGAFRRRRDFGRRVQPGGGRRRRDDEDLDFPQIWIHIVADLVGGVMAAVVFKVANPDDK